MNTINTRPGGRRCHGRRGCDTSDSWRAEYFGEQAYVGVLFLLGAVAGGLVALRLWQRNDPQAWALGSLIAVGMGAGFILSRTVGLPGFHEGEWELSGLVSLLLETGFVGLAVVAVRNGARESLLESRITA